MIPISALIKGGGGALKTLWIVLGTATGIGVLWGFYLGGKKDIKGMRSEVEERATSFIKKKRKGLKNLVTSKLIKDMERQKIQAEDLLNRIEDTIKLYQEGIEDDK